MSKSAKVVLGRVLIKRGRQWPLSGEEQTSQIGAVPSAFDPDRTSSVHRSSGARFEFSPWGGTNVEMTGFASVT